MDRHRSHIRTCLHCVHRQVISKIKMSAVSFVGKHQHSVLVGDVHDPPDIRTYAVIGRVIHQHGFCVGVFFNCFFNVLNRHTKRYTKLFVSPGVYVYRHSSADNKGIYCASVDVSGHNYLFPRLAGCKNHSLHSGGGAVDYKKGIMSAKSLCRKAFSLLYDPGGVTEVIKIFH